MIYYIYWKMFRYARNMDQVKIHPVFVPFIFTFTQVFSCSVVPSYHLSLKDEDMIFLETCKNLRHQNHCIIECVPVPKEIGDMAPIYFKACLHCLDMVCWKDLWFRIDYSIVKSHTTDWVGSLRFFTYFNDIRGWHKNSQIVFGTFLLA